LKDALAIDTSANDFYQTQYRLLESRAVCEAVVRRLNLTKLAEFGARAHDPDANPGPSAESSEKALAAAIGALNRGMEVSPVRMSRLVKITFTSTDPKLAAQVANTITQIYLDYTMDRKLKVSQMASQFLSRRIEEQRRKLEASQLALQKYMEEQQLVTAISDNYGDITAQKLADLRSRLVEAETSRKEAEARYSLAKSTLADPKRSEGIPELLQNPVFQQLRTKQAETYKQFAEISQRYGDKHPKIIAIRAELASMANDLRVETAKVVDALKQSYEIALAKQKALEEALESEKAEAMKIRKKAIGFVVLKREVDTNQQLYDMLLSRAKEARLTEDIDVGAVTVVDPAKIPLGPSWPRMLPIAALSLVLGLFLALGGGFLLEYMDNSVKFPEQIQKNLSLPHLGLVPYYSALAQKKQFNLLDAEQDQQGAMVMEAFRHLQTSISLSRAENPPKIIVITSASSSEGKSLVAAYLAATYAAAGEKTVLLDADLRRPRQHRLWGQGRVQGLSSVLAGTAKLEEVLKREVAPLLDLIPSGPIPPKPNELLKSKVMPNLLTVLAKSYSTVIVDSPPILPIADAYLLAHYADGVVMVVAAGMTTLPAVRESAEKITSSGGQLLGVVLNRTAHKRSDYYYRGYRYKYYYNYEYAQKPRAEDSKTVSQAL
jgi:capsular exopolysaccharide synthesis family protein